MTAPCWSKGLEAPKSRTNPVSLDELVKVTVVPVLMQKALLGLAPEILGVALCGGSFTAADVDRAGGRSRTAGDFRGTNACRIRGRADIVFDLLFGVLTDDVEVQEYGQNEQRS